MRNAELGIRNDVGHVVRYAGTPRGSNVARPVARSEHGCEGRGEHPGPLRVLLAGKLTALAAPGGGEVQMQATAEALRELGHDARMWRPWEDDLDDCDVLHLFGTLPEHLPVIETAHRRGVSVALSTIAWYDLGSLWREPRGLARRWAACGKFLLRRAAPRLPSWRRQLYHSVDLLLPNSQAEARQLWTHFALPRERIRVVPN